MSTDLTMSPVETTKDIGISDEDVDALMNGTLRRITTATPEQVTTAVFRREST
jgi:hypothetical protein